MKKIISVIAFVTFFLGNVAIVGAASYPVGGYQYYLAGSGITSSQTTITLTSFKTSDGRPITMTMFGAIGYGALDPQTTLKLENISFTGVTQNANGTAVLSGVTRGVDFVMPYAASSSLARSHSGGSTFILTNTASYYGTQFGMVNNPSVVTDYWSFPTPLAANNPATKNYVDTHISGGTTTVSAVTGVGIAGETYATGTFVYLKASDARWYKAGTNVPESMLPVTVTGISQGSGASGIAISGGVLVYGLDENQSGLAAGTTYFATGVAGSLGTATTSRMFGKARTATSFWFSPSFITTVATNTWTGINNFATTTNFLATSTVNIGAFPAYMIGKNKQIITTTGTSTFIVPPGVKHLWVEVLGGGGAGGGCSAGASNASGGGGGGAGGYAQEIVDVSATTSIQVYVGVVNDRTSFGPDPSAFLRATGGVDGSEGVSGTGGVGTGGDINITGTGGGGGTVDGTGINTDAQGGTGGANFYGGAGSGPSGDAAGVAAGGYGSGGGGGACRNSSQNGGGGMQGVIVVRW